MAKQSVTLEVLSYHASASTDDAVRLMVNFYCCRTLWWWLVSYWCWNFLYISLAGSQNTFISIFPTARFRLRRPKSGWWWHAQGMSQNVSWFGSRRALSHRLRDALSVAVKREEELPKRYLPQLAACIQRRADDVRYPDIDAVVEGFRGDWVPCSRDWLLVSWPRPPRNQQLVPNQGIFASGAALFNLHDGASSLRSMFDDSEQSRESNSFGIVIRGLLQNDSNSWGCNPLDRLGCLLQVRSLPGIHQDSF